MITLKTKPLSLNSAYRGRRFTTPSLQSYKNELWYLLPKSIDVDVTLPMHIFLEFGLSSVNSDGDNYVKCFQDVVSDKYDFNDKMIFKWSIEKKKVNKGEEYVKFDLKNIV